MALNFPNRKLSAFISVNNGKYTTIQRSTYMDLKYQLLLNQNFFGLYLIKNLLHTPYKILESEMFKSIKPFKSFISHMLGSGQNNSSSPASVAQLDAPSDWRPGGRGFNPRRGRQHSFVEIDHEIFSTVILSLPLIQEGQLSVSGERMCTILVNRLED